MAQYTFDTLKDFELAGISLPSGYQRVEWLQSTGTQCIKIPCQLNAINSISTKYKSALGWIFGNCAEGNGSKGLILVQQATTAVSWFGNRQYQDNLPYNSTNSYTKIVAGDDAANVPSSLNAIGIFCNLYQNNIAGRTSSTYYYFITNLFSLVACRRTSDSVAGLYDIANGVFYSNAGTGTFSIGGDVAPITPIAGDTATITDLGITLTGDGTDWYVTSDITIPTFSQATQLFSFAKGNNGVTATITDLGITLTSNGTDWYVTSDITIPTLSQATQLFSFAKGNNGVTATVTDLGITLTSDGTDWYVTSDITLATLSQATQLFSFAKSNNGVRATVTSTGGVYKYEGDAWQIWYTIIPPLVFKGMSFEQTDFWQRPEMVFRGFSFEGENILRYYGVKIDVNGETERNYIPCIRTSDGIAGMYDTVNGVFYASIGTNNFTT